MNYKPIFLISLLLVLLSCGTEETADGEDGYPIEEEVEVNDVEVEPQWSAEFLMGKFDQRSHPDFAEVDPEWSSRPGMYLHREALEAYGEMRAAAASEGIEFVVRSATRNFEAQKVIWEEKWRGERLSSGKNAKEAYPDPVERALDILRYSAMPGTSRHHWGTEVDLNSFDNSWFEHGKGLKLYEWLQKNAASFGFCQPYTEKGEARPSGYQEERWHWSYTPLSAFMTRDASLLLTDEDISEFEGAETAASIGIVENYILGINQECLIHSKEIANDKAE